MESSEPPQRAPSPVPKIWWSQASFIVLMHLAALVGIMYNPIWSARRATLVMAFLSWNLAGFGITIGYHRLYSHRAFRASLCVRFVLAILGTSALEGSIKWWCLTHRLHHRFTDDPVYDPYAASRGLFYSHIGWLFFKPTYDRMKLIERDDLENDLVVVLQHKYYVPLALVIGFVVPTLLGSFWGDTAGGFIWGGLVSHLCTWHSTFLVNSLAHWHGLQPYSDENSSRGNFILAFLSAGEGNHNFHHAFPYDFRSGPSNMDWDPSKWIILCLCRLKLVSDLRRVREDDLIQAVHRMQRKSSGGVVEPERDCWKGETWRIEQVEKYIELNKGTCVIVVDGFVMDLTSYLDEHPGGASILRKYAFRRGEDDKAWSHRASWAFHGGLNNHSWAAKRRMQELRIAKIIE